MFCNKCGNQVDENVNFCPKCGNDLTEALKEIRAKRALDMLNNYDEVMKNAEQPVQQTIQQPIKQTVVQQPVQQPVQPVNQTTQTSQTTQATNAQQKKKSNTGVIVAICLVCAVVVFGAIGYGIKTLVGNLIGNVTSVIDDASKEIEKVEKDIDNKVKEKDKNKGNEEIDVVNNKSDVALAKEEAAKVFKENGKRVGSKEYGFVSVPKDWGTFYDVGGTEALQYSYGNEWIVTIFSVDASQADALTYASAVYSSFDEENVEDVDVCTVAVNDYTAYQVAAYYPDEKTHLICWFIDGKENDKTYYIAVEGPDPTSDYFYNIVLTFAENE